MARPAFESPIAHVEGVAAVDEQEPELRLQLRATGSRVATTRDHNIFEPGGLHRLLEERHGSYARYAVDDIVVVMLRPAWFSSLPR